MKMQLVIMFCVSFAPLLNSQSVIANESFIGKARVVRSEPAYQKERRLISKCDYPGASATDLASMLEWDLVIGSCAGFSEHQVVLGYKVYYLWDDQEFSLLMDRQPDDWISVKVDIDL